MRYIKLVIVLVVFTLASAVLAQGVDDRGNPNDPEVNDRANACFEGGSLEGRCNQDFNDDGVVDDQETWWAWTCGWYLIRYEHGMEDAVPGWCESVIPDPAIIEEVVFDFSAVCTTSPVAPKDILGMFVQANLTLSAPIPNQADVLFNFVFSTNTDTDIDPLGANETTAVGIGEMSLDRIGPMIISVTATVRDSGGDALLVVPCSVPVFA